MDLPSLTPPTFARTFLPRHWKKRVYDKLSTLSPREKKGDAGVVGVDHRGLMGSELHRMGVRILKIPLGGEIKGRRMAVSQLIQSCCIH